MPLNEEIDTNPQQMSEVQALTAEIARCREKVEELQIKKETLKETLRDRAQLCLDTFPAWMRST
jgi:hypothetical protein